MTTKVKSILSSLILALMIGFLTTPGHSKTVDGVFTPEPGERIGDLTQGEGATVAVEKGPCPTCNGSERHEYPASIQQEANAALTPGTTSPEKQKNVN